MPNSPAMASIWMTLAPATLRERKMESGTSGCRARVSRQEQPDEAVHTALSPRVRVDVQPCSATPTMV